MSPLDRSPGTLAALTERELEALRLLAAGHTVKSIAATLGRSEASINERLRDARRKTGVGSSRELARLVEARKSDAQKNWDRNIDLSAPQASDDRSAAPDNPGRGWPKGTIAMFVTMSLAAGLLVTATGPLVEPAPTPAGQTVQSGAEPLAGRWSLDVARIPAEERPRSVTIAFTASADGKWSTVVDVVAPDGTSRRAVSTAAADGVAVPVGGTMGNIDSVSLRHPQPDTLVMTLGKNGETVSTRVYTVAKDRRTMTETIIWGGRTIPGMETTTFTRID